MRTAVAIAVVLLLAACGKQDQIREVPPPAVVRVPVDRMIKLPAWATRQLPEDAPKANTPEEATRLANARLETVRYANCRSLLLEKLDSGAPVSGRECDK